MKDVATYPQLRRICKQTNASFDELSQLFLQLNIPSSYDFSPQLIACLEPIARTAVDLALFDNRGSNLEASLSLADLYVDPDYRAKPGGLKGNIFFGDYGTVPVMALFTQNIGEAIVLKAVVLASIHNNRSENNTSNISGFATALRQYLENRPYDAPVFLKAMSELAGRYQGTDLINAVRLGAFSINRSTGSTRSRKGDFF